MAVERTIVENKKREPYIDVLKGVAMLGVILTHYYAAPNSVLTAIATAGGRCPQLFFIASAFLTWKVLDKKDVDYKNFYKKRLLRIAPIYWLGLIVALILPVVTIEKHTVGDYLTHISFVNGFVPQWTNNIMHVEWYMTDLALFYMLCPLLMKISYNFKSSVITFLLSILLSSTMIVMTNSAFSVQIAEKPYCEMFFHTFFFVHQLPVWMMGVVLYYLIKAGKTPNWGGVLLILVIVVIITGSFELLRLNKHYLTSSFIAGLDFSGLFLLCYKLREHFSAIVFQPIRWIGRHSFGIYCFHFATIRTLGYYGIITTTSLSGWMIGLIVATAASILVGYMAELGWNHIQSKIVKRS